MANPNDEPQPTFETPEPESPFGPLPRFLMEGPSFDGLDLERCQHPGRVIRFNAPEKDKLRQGRTQKNTPHSAGCSILQLLLSGDLARAVRPLPA
ncbi:MAG: hypothetical protein RLY93_19030 [Sumerlaeia bacterium]